MEKINIAVVTTGAVSLGSYEAGVLYELFHILRLPINADKYEIDVLTGASAGSVNSVIYALAAVYDPELIGFMRKIWVDKLDILQLLRGKSFSKSAIFSDKVIREIKEEVEKRFANLMSTGTVPASRVKLGLTLANLSGIPYVVNFKNIQKEYKLTTFADWYSCEVPGSIKNPQDAGKLIDVATASGAFPFAFPAVNLERRAQDYANTALPQGQSTFDFIYVDGGLFNNEPINRAKTLAKGLDEQYVKQSPDSKEAPRRIYLLVDPTPPEEYAPFNKNKPSIAAVAGRLIPAILTEAHYRDWNDAIKINQRLKWQADFLKDFKKQFISPAAYSVNILNTLSSAFDDYAGKLAKEKLELTHKETRDMKIQVKEDEIEKYKNDNLGRIEGYLRSEGILEEKGGKEESPSLAKTLSNLAFIMECVGALREKVELDIRPVFPPENMHLAGKFWGSFGGFTWQKLREHDFEVGRRAARDFAASPVSKGGLGLDTAGLPPIEDIKKFTGTFKDVPLRRWIMVAVMAAFRLVMAIGKAIFNPLALFIYFCAAIITLFLIVYG